MNEHSMSGKHMMILLLCCVIPLAAFFFISVLGVPLSSLGTVALVLLCPLMHILMMRGMAKQSSQGQASCHPTKGEQPRALLAPSDTRSLTSGTPEV